MTTFEITTSQPTATCGDRVLTVRHLDADRIAPCDRRIVPAGPSV